MGHAVCSRLARSEDRLTMAPSRVLPLEGPQPTGPAGPSGLTDEARRNAVRAKVHTLGSSIAEARRLGAEARRSQVELAALLFEAKAGNYAASYGYACFADWVEQELRFRLRKAQLL